MRVAIDISPIDSKSKSAHKVRGVGRYISLLIDNIEKYDKDNEYFFTNNPQSIKNIDLIHYPYFDPFFITLPLNKKFKTVVTVHDLIPITHKKYFPVGLKGSLKWNFNKVLLKRVDGIITDSEASKKAVVEEVGFASSKIFPVHLAVSDEFKKLDLSTEEKSKIRKKYSLPEKFFLYVGDVTWNKNLPRIISAIKKINVPFVMVGKALAEDYDRNHSWNKDRLLVEKETNSELFIKTGYVPDEDLVKIYNIATALLMPSLDEGFGLPVLEAMKSGCPVITSKEGSLPEVGGDAALYANSLDEESIVSCLKKVSEEKLRTQLIQKGLEQSKKFTIEKFIKDTVSSYKKINV